MPGVQNLQGLQEQVTKYIERNITILGDCTKPLVIDLVHMQLNSVGNVHDGQVEKLDPLMLLLNNYVGQMRERSVDLVEQLYAPLFSKVALIGVQKSNTSEIQKVQIKVVLEFFRLLQKACCDYSSAILLTQRNLPYL